MEPGGSSVRGEPKLLASASMTSSSVLPSPFCDNNLMACSGLDDTTPWPTPESLLQTPVCGLTGLMRRTIGLRAINLLHVNAIDRATAQEILQRSISAIETGFDCREPSRLGIQGERVLPQSPVLPVSANPTRT